MQSLHYNSGSIKLTRERCTMVSRWETNEVTRWIEGLAGIQSDTVELFRAQKIDGVALTMLLREDLIRMGIAKLDQQLILMQSIDLLLTLTNRLSSETLALLFMRIHSTATICHNLLKRPDDKDVAHANSNGVNSPEFYAAASNLSEAIVAACHWLGRLPFIENIEYIDLREKIIKVLIQIRVLLRNWRVADQINMPKTKLIVEIGDLRTKVITWVRQSKDSLFSSDCYLTRVHLRRPLKDDVNIEYTTMPDYTHVISSIETESMSSMGSGFSAINIGDEIIEINNQVVIGWDPVHFHDLIRASTHSSEICLLVKKMPRHNDDEVYTKRLAEGPQNPHRSRARGALERREQKTQENRTMLLKQEGEIEVESDDETLYQSKRSSQIKRDQHSSLPDLTEPLPNGNSTYSNGETPKQPVPPSATPSASTTGMTSPASPTERDSKKKGTERPQSAGGPSSSPNATPKSPRKTGIESYFSTIFRPRQDTKSVIADTNDHVSKDHPQLVNIKRLHSMHKHNSSTSLHDEQISTSPPSTLPSSSVEKNGSVSSLQTTASSARSSLTSIFRASDSSDKGRRKRSNDDTSGKGITFRHEIKMELTSIFSGSATALTSKPPLNTNDTRKNSDSVERRGSKRASSYKRISCKDLGKGDCEGFLYRYMAKGTISFVQWKLFWCVLKGGTLYVFKSADEKNQEIEIRLEGKNVSPAPEKRKYAFRICDETNKDLEYFHCTSRDEMAKWMNKMGLAAINFNIDDSKIAGFHKGFVNSREGSPATTPTIGLHFSRLSKQPRTKPTSSAGDSENESDKESVMSWQKSTSHYSSISDIEPIKERILPNEEKRMHPTSAARHVRSSSSISAISLPTANNSLPKSADSEPVAQVKKPSFKGHHRTCSSPIRFPPAYEDDQENAYVNAAPRLSDPESPNDQPHQRIFVNSQVLASTRRREYQQSAPNHAALMLNSSGGFTTPTAISSSTSSDKTASFSPSLSRSSSQRPSGNSLSLPGDEDLSFVSSRSASYCNDRPNSFSDDPLSPVFQAESFLPATLANSSSQQNLATVSRSAPMYISVHAQANDDESLFPRRSPSLAQQRNEPADHSTRHELANSGVYRSHRFSGGSLEDEQKR